MKNFVVISIFTSLFYLFTCLAETNDAPVFITVPPGSNVIIITNPTPPIPPEVPMSVTMRRAAQLAHGKDAPWTQRFVATRVKKDARSREASGVLAFTTNFIVTFTPVSEETNSPIAYGATKSKSFTLEIEYPVKKGDEFFFFPSE